MKSDYDLFRDVEASGVLHAEGRAALRELENRMMHRRAREEASYRERLYPGCLPFIDSDYQQEKEALGNQAYGGAKRGEQVGSRGKLASRIPVHDPVAYAELRKTWRYEQRQVVQIRRFMQSHLDNDTAA